MFPTVRVSFSGPFKPTKPSDFYAVLLDIIPVDSRRYRYAYHRSAWLVAGKADPPPIPRLHAHPDTPFTCEALTKQVISFEKAKLTNNELDRNGQVSTKYSSHIDSNIPIRIVWLQECPEAIFIFCTYEDLSRHIPIHMSTQQ